MSSDATAIIDKAKVVALNEKVAGSHEHLWAGDTTNACRSDADATLLLLLPFREMLRLSAIVVDGPAADAPTTVKVWANRAVMSFDDVGDEPSQVRQARSHGVGVGLGSGGPSQRRRVLLLVCSSVAPLQKTFTPPLQVFVLAPKDLGQPLKLKTTKFNAVASLAIFVEREGADVVALSKLAILGAPVGKTDLTGLKKHEHE